MNVPEILKQMTLADKIALCSGKNFWETKDFQQYGIPSVFMCDGPHGLRKQEDASDMLGVNKSRAATCFPAAVTSGASWDTALLEELGAAIGAEAAEQGVALVLGPGANIKRNPRCGRNFEYFSEDPYLTGKLAAAHIRGVQRNGTAASLKHFACNNQETSRFNSNGVLDERTLRELYLTGFELAVKEAQPETVMCSYPKINGTHVSDSKELLTDILREQWGFRGLVVTDWGAMNDRLEGFRAGCDLSMPGGSNYMEAEAVAAVQAGKLSEETIDRCAARVLELVDRTSRQKKGVADREAHHSLARKVAESGAVLLKNEENLLPLRQGAKVALIGDMAKHPRYQGAGSSHINPTRLVSAVEAMPEAVFAQGCTEKGESSERLLREAECAAREAEVAVLFVGLPNRYESEGFDRDDLQMPVGHRKLIERVTAANPSTVVVLSCGSVVECPWADSVKAILYMGLAGQASGEAAAALLYGRTTPSGKLTESWPMTYADCPSAESFGGKDALYEEGLYVGYRYYDKSHTAVRWPFGYGLSYTSFAYSNLRVEDNIVRANITNTGSVAGAEVVQLYVAAPQSGLYRPEKELKGFSKVFLQPGESKEVAFALDERSFAVWNGGWVVPKGTYLVLLAASSQDIRLSAELDVDGVEIDIPAWQSGSWYERPVGQPKRTDWERLLGRSYEPEVLKKGSFTMDNSVEEMMPYSLIMKLMYKATETTIAKGFGGKKDYSNPEFKMLMAASAGSPLRSMQVSGGIKGNLFKGLLAIANGHFFRGLRWMVTK